MSEVVEHYLLRLTRTDVGAGDDRADERSGLRISLRSIKDGTLVDFEEPSELLEYLDIQADS